MKHYPLSDDILPARSHGLGLHLALCLLLAGCAYRVVPGPLVPLHESAQSPEMRVSDDGTVAYVKDRLEISLRPMLDSELNRLFPAESSQRENSTNPYTYGNWKPVGANTTPSRHTVFRLQVKNYAYPKVLVDPTRMTLTTSSGDKYRPLTFSSMKEQFYPVAVAYAGNAYARFDAMVDIVRKTLYDAHMVFSGQESDGYVVFPLLGEGENAIEVRLDDIDLRFDFRDLPVEKTSATFRFRREIRRE